MAVDHSAEQRREALPILRVQSELLLDEDHRDVAVAVGHRNVHGRIAKFINDVTFGSHFKKIVCE